MIVDDLHTRAWVHVGTDASLIRTKHKSGRVPWLFPGVVYRTTLNYRITRKAKSTPSEGLKDLGAPRSSLPSASIVLRSTVCSVK